ncbi:hypothetical protein [Brevibacillus sp. AG162]|uniref:hypothetical protein n=1 Tax=Brevibacillus sp. AG162 TaxID=2572910 RepID=UPI002104AD1F|nr:hypothetical protein [Brevibacillus sp. AG162]
MKNLDAVGDLKDLNYLALHSISKLPLHFVNRLKKLKHLRILLGGREHIQEIEENEIDDLEISRVRGFHDLSNIANFRALTRLVMEDQIQLREVSFDREMKALEESYRWWLIHYGNARLNGGNILTIVSPEHREYDDSDLLYIHRLNKAEGWWVSQFPHRLDLFVPDSDELYFLIRLPEMNKVSFRSWRIFRHP